MKGLLLRKISLRQLVWTFMALAGLGLAGIVVPPLGTCPCRAPVPLVSRVELEPSEVRGLLHARAAELEELFSLNCSTIYAVRHHEHEPEWFSGRAHHRLRGEVAVELTEPEKDTGEGQVVRFTVDGEALARLVLIERHAEGSYVHARSDSYLARLAAKQAFDALLATDPGPAPAPWAED